MDFAIDPRAVRAAWAATVTPARALLAGSDVSDVRARGDDLADLAPATMRAWARATGAAATAVAVCDEHTANVEACLLDYARSDHHGAGVFDGLAR